MRRFGRWGRRHAPLGRTARVRLFLALLALTLCTVWVSWRLEPVLQDLTEHEATACVTQLVASAAEGALLEAELPQGSPVSIQYGDDGAISSLTTDTARLNSLRAFVLEHVQQELGERASVDLEVPLGSLLGGPFLNGRGPDLPVRVTFSGIVTAEFESSFTAAGYNQTRHTVSLRVTADAYTYLLGAESQLQAETVIPVSETILVGEVPYVVGDVPVS